MFITIIWFGIVVGYCKFHGPCLQSRKTRYYWSMIGLFYLGYIIWTSAGIKPEGLFHDRGKLMC